MQVIRQPKVYDVCIVGSGAGGGMAAKVLTEAGAEVALLEAGAMWDTEKDSKMFVWPYDSPRRGAAARERSPAPGGRCRQRIARIDAVIGRAGAR